MGIFKKLFGDYNLYDVKSDDDKLEQSDELELYLINVRQFHQETKQFSSGNLIINDTYSDHKIIFNHQRSLNNINNCLFKVTNGDRVQYDRIVFIQVVNTPIFCNFVLNDRYVKKINTFYENVNSRVKDRIKEFDKKEESRIADALQNPTLYKICHNFISNRETVFFTDINYSMALERILFNLSHIGIDILMVPFEDYSNYAPDTLILEKAKSYYNELANLMRIVTNYNFNLPVDSNNNVLLLDSFYILWDLLQSVAIDYFSKQYLDKQGITLEFLNGLKINECIYYHVTENVDPLSEKDLSEFTYVMIKTDKLPKRHFYQNRQYIKNEVEEMSKQINLINMENELLANTSTVEKHTSIDDIDLMSGTEFEDLIGQLFKKLGFSTEVTKTSGDQGIDVIAEKNGQRIGIQSKCYSGTVGNKAIQEVVAGLNFYNLNKGLVVTNNYFTDSAKELAASNNIVLWDRTILIEKLRNL